MSLLLRAVFAATLALPATSAFAQDRPAAHTNAEACLRQNAEAAVRASSGAADAAEFLTTYLCAETVSYASAYDQNMALVAAMKGMASSLTDLAAQTPKDEDADAEADEGAASSFDFGSLMGGDLTVDPVTGALIVPEGNPGMMGGVMQAQSGQLQSLIGQRPPVFIRELAGRLVLEHKR